MSFTLRRRIVAYDNIASGSATGKERTIEGNAGSTELYAQGERQLSSTDAQDIERHISGTSIPTDENVG